VKMPIIKTVAVASLAVIAAAIGTFTYKLAKKDAEASFYRSRLIHLRGEYEKVRGAFNDAVRKTAVTELVVEDGKLTVRVRTATGEITQVPVPFYEPTRAIYVDYVVLDGRLWIRRVFDEETSPRNGVLIDPALARVEFDEEHAHVGKAVYRDIGEGRWVVTVTGGGSLGLARASSPVDLISTPEVRDFEEIVRTADEIVRGMTPADVIRHAAGLE